MSRRGLRAGLAPQVCAVAFVVARLFVVPARRWAPAALVRINVSGRPVPAVLGSALGAGTLAGLATAAARRDGIGAGRAGSVAGLVLLTGAAGWFDDTRGDEAARGFQGHLRELRRGRVTGGAVKLAAGGLGGLAAARALARRDRLAVAAATALAANLVNLLDRAPGRAAKVSALAGGALVVGGAEWFRPAAAALLGALLACAGPDLREEAMLGDTGANPLGAVLGLGAALSLGGRGRRALVAALLLANAASERWSFSRAIERVAWLRALDRWGRSSSIEGPTPR